MPTFTVIGLGNIVCIVCFVMQIVLNLGLPIKLGWGDCHTYFHVIISPNFTFFNGNQWILQAACKTSLHVNLSTGGMPFLLIFGASPVHAFQWSYDNGAWLRACNWLFIGIIWHQVLSCLNRVQHEREKMWNTNFISECAELYRQNIL